MNAWKNRRVIFGHSPKRHAGGLENGGHPEPKRSNSPFRRNDKKPHDAHAHDAHGGAKKGFLLKCTGTPGVPGYARTNSSPKCKDATNSDVVGSKKASRPLPPTLSSRAALAVATAGQGDSPGRLSRHRSRHLCPGFHWHWAIDT